MPGPSRRAPAARWALDGASSSAAPATTARLGPRDPAVRNVVLSPAEPRAPLHAGPHRGTVARQAQGRDPFSPVVTTRSAGSTTAFGYLIDEDWRAATRIVQGGPPPRRGTLAGRPMSPSVHLTQDPAALSATGWRSPRAAATRTAPRSASTSRSRSRVARSSAAAITSRCSTTRCVEHCARGSPRADSEPRSAQTPSADRQVLLEWRLARCGARHPGAPSPERLRSVGTTGRRTTGASAALPDSVASDHRARRQHG